MRAELRIIFIFRTTFSTSASFLTFNPYPTGTEFILPLNFYAPTVRGTVGGGAYLDLPFFIRPKKFLILWQWWKSGEIRDTFLDLLYLLILF